jgi:DNA-binding FadR family transcriptional regulator
MDSTEEVNAFRETLLENIRSASWKFGEKLPAERILSATHNIGRASVRRILGELKELGLITQKIGSGTYVAEGACETLQTAESDALRMGTSPAELMEVRVMFEPMIADLVVRNGTSADFLRMDDCCVQAEAAQSLAQFEYWDGALHQAMADASHNNMVKSVLQLVNKMREQSEWGALKKKSLTPDRRAAYEREHRALVNALKDRDADKAKRLTLEHLLHVRNNLLGY